MSEDSVFWDDSFSVGFKLIDDQHKELVKMTNSLFEGCKKGNTAADIAFVKTIRSAVEYAQVHFFTEEKYMKETDYPDLPDHKAEHQTFVGNVIQAVKKFEDEDLDPLELARFLKNWLFNHIAKVDKKYAPYLEKIDGEQGALAQDNQ